MALPPQKKGESEKQYLARVQSIRAGESAQQKYERRRADEVEYSRTKPKPKPKPPKGPMTRIAEVLGESHADEAKAKRKREGKPY